MAKRNLHPRYCPWCRKPGDDYAELGMRDRIYHCKACENQYLGAAWPGSCPACRAPSGKAELIRQLQPDEPIPGKLCDPCQGKAADMALTVEKGGVYFRCKKCNAQGVIEADVPFAKDIRLKVGKPAPEDVGVEIENCPNCTPEEDVAEATPDLGGGLDHIQRLTDDEKAQLLRSAKEAATDPQADTVDLFDDNSGFAKDWDAAVDNSTITNPSKMDDTHTR